MTNSTKNPFKNLALTYGGLLGLFTVLLSVLLYSFNLHNEKLVWPTFVSMLGGIGITYYAIYIYRNQLGGFINLGQAMKLGIAVALIGGVIGALSNYIFMTYIEPDTLELMLERGRIEAEKSGLSDEMIEMNLEMSKKFMSPIMMGTFAILFSIFMGAIYSLISGLILQKKDPSNY